MPRVVGEPSVDDYTYKISHIDRHASRMRMHPTPAERRLIQVLGRLNGGVLKGRFRPQYAISGKWIVDVFIPEIRLAIEVDGSSHWSEQQMAIDRKKEEDCARFDITLLRITNAEVFDDFQALVQKLRGGWRAARGRKNKIIGKAYPIAFR